VAHHPDQISSLAQVEALVAATIQTFHGVDILINNAGIVRAADFLDMSEVDFDEVIRVNLKGVFLVRGCFQGGSVCMRTQYSTCSA